MYKILEIGMTRNIGGMETYIMEQYRHLNRDIIRYDFANLTGEYSMAFEDEIRNNGDVIYNIISRKKNILKHYYKWFVFFKKYHNVYDAVVLNTCDLYHMCPLFFAKLWGIKTIIIHSHNNGSEKKEGFLRKILISFNKILMKYSVSNYWACSKIAGEWMFGKKVFFEIIHNAIDTKKYIYNERIRKKIRNDLKIEDDFVLGHVGRFSYQKNHKFIITIFNYLLKKIPNAKLLLIGDYKLNKNYTNEVNILIKKYNIKNKILFLGSKKDIAEYYQAMDCFILPSHFEGLGIVGIEAQAASLPCIVSTGVSKELGITDLVKYISLNENIDIWINEILNSKLNKRRDRYKDIVNAGYDIEEEIKEIQMHFIKNIENNKRRS